MTLNLSSLASAMAAAALGVIKQKTPDVIAYATGETAKIAQSIVTIEALAVAGQITPEEAKLHLQRQSMASRSVLLTVKGLGLLEAEAAINAALAAVKDVVNGALPFKLL